MGQGKEHVIVVHGGLWSYHDGLRRYFPNANPLI
jgi:G:T-mismatch repair DNA endonuclease (very short patch repair protein)